MNSFSCFIGRGMGVFNSKLSESSPLHRFRRDVFNQNATRFRGFNSASCHSQQDGILAESRVELVDILKRFSPAEPVSAVDARKTGNAERETGSHLKQTESNAVRVDLPAVEQEEAFRNGENNRLPCDTQPDTCSTTRRTELVEILRNFPSERPMRAVDTQTVGQFNDVPVDSPGFKQEEAFRNGENNRLPCDTQPDTCSTTRRTELVEILRNCPSERPMRAADTQTVGQFYDVPVDSPGFKQEEGVGNAGRSGIPQSAAVSTGWTFSWSDHWDSCKNRIKNLCPLFATKTQQDRSSTSTEETSKAEVKATANDIHETTGEAAESRTEELCGYSVIQTDASGFRQVTTPPEQAKLESKSLSTLMCVSVCVVPPETDSQQRPEQETEPGPHGGHLPGVWAWPRRLFRFTRATFEQACQRISSFLQRVRRLFGTAFQTTRTRTADLLDAAQTRIRNADESLRNMFVRLVEEVSNVTQTLSHVGYEILMSIFLCALLTYSNNKDRFERFQRRVIRFLNRAKARTYHSVISAGERVTAAFNSTQRRVRNYVRGRQEGQDGEPGEANVQTASQADEVPQQNDSRSAASSPKATTRTRIPQSLQTAGKRLHKSFVKTKDSKPTAHTTEQRDEH